MKLKEILGNIGCSALSAIAPPFGNMASTLLKNVLGLKSDASEKDIENALNNATPEQIIELKKADNEFKIKMQELDIDLVKLDKKDTQDARSFASMNGLKAVIKLAAFNSFFLITVVTGVGILFYFDKLQGLEALEASILTLIVREAYGRYEQASNFFFGSSQGSKMKSIKTDK